MKTKAMQAATRPLQALTAADVMTTPVTSIPQETTLREAALLLSRSAISGAPVVDQDGACVGVLSSSDFVTWAGKGGEPGQRDEVTTFIAPWGELIDLEESANNELRQYMTAKLITVTPRTPIGEVAQKMVEAHIHRVLVVDENRPRGIVTSTDLLAALARATQHAVAYG
jgi:CBS domain-containing protein